MRNTMALVMTLVVAASAFPHSIVDFETDHMEIKQSGTAGKAVRGEYSWIAPNGKEVYVKYIADNRGFRILENENMFNSVDDYDISSSSSSAGTEEEINVEAPAPENTFAPQRGSYSPQDISPSYSPAVIAPQPIEAMATVPEAAEPAVSAKRIAEPSPAVQKEERVAPVDPTEAPSTATESATAAAEEEGAEEGGEGEGGEGEGGEGEGGEGEGGEGEGGEGEGAEAEEAEAEEEEGAEEAEEEETEY